MNPARLGLAAIRIGNGAVALLAPAGITRRLGVDPDANPAVLYTLRLFGIRTVFLGVDVLVRDGRDLDRALSHGVVIHLSDAVAALLALRRRQLPAKTAVLTAMVSTVNVACCIAARRTASTNLST